MTIRTITITSKVIVGSMIPYICEGSLAGRHKWATGEYAMVVHTVEYFKISKISVTA